MVGRRSPYTEREATESEPPISAAFSRGQAQAVLCRPVGVLGGNSRIFGSELRVQGNTAAKGREGVLEGKEPERAPQTLPALPRADPWTRHTQDRHTAPQLRPKGLKEVGASTRETGFVVRVRSRKMPAKMQ